jgi:protein-tyrosine phosphatase
MHVVFVCASNTCLSPLAAGVFAELADHQKLTITVASAGSLDGQAGEPVDKQALTVARSRGIDLSGHTARKINANDFTRADLIVAFDRSDLRLLTMQRPRGCRTEIRLFSSVLGKGGPSDFADPSGGPRERIEAVYETIERGVREVIAGLRGRLAAMEIGA